MQPDVEAVIQTGFATQETAIEALRLGAFDYITKPCKMAEIEAILGRIAEKRELTNKTLALQTRVEAAEGHAVLVGRSPAMQAVHRLIATVAPTDATVMILGETGTGKELVARTIFEQSLRAATTFVPVNCGALRRTWSRASCLATASTPSPERSATTKGCSRLPTAGRCFSTNSAN